MRNFKHISTLLLGCLIASLFWCGDAECLEGTSHDNCASLVCSLLNGNTTSTQDTSHSSERECSCVCHVLSVIPNPIMLSCSLTAQQNTFEVILQTISSFNRPVYRPPIVA